MPPKRKQNGTGVVKDIVNYVRTQQLLSKGLGMIPHPGAQLAASIARQVGLGKKKKKKAQKGKGFFSDLGGGIGSVFGGLGGGIGSVAKGLFGGKKRKPKTLKL